jgi:hypothetical protein
MGWLALACLSKSIDSKSMRIIKNTRFILIVACAAILSGARSVFAYEAGIIKTIRGQVRVERGSSNIEAKVGDTVQERDRISVQGDGSVGISMDDETLLSIGPNSAIVFDRYTYNPVTREGQVETSILKGTLRYVTGLIGRLNPGAVKVTTPTAVIGLRGTEFIVEVPDAK